MGQYYPIGAKKKKGQNTPHGPGVTSSLGAMATSSPKQEIVKKGCLALNTQTKKVSQSWIFKPARRRLLFLQASVFLSLLLPPTKKPKKLFSLSLF